MVVVFDVVPPIAIPPLPLCEPPLKDVSPLFEPPLLEPPLADVSPLFEPPRLLSPVTVEPPCVVVNSVPFPLTRVVAPPLPMATVPLVVLVVAPPLAVAPAVSSFVLHPAVTATPHTKKQMLSESIG